jgi:hypothetical protein
VTLDKRVLEQFHLTIIRLSSLTQECERNFFTIWEKQEKEFSAEVLRTLYHAQLVAEPQTLHRTRSRCRTAKHCHYKKWGTDRAQPAGVSTTFNFQTSGNLRCIFLNRRFSKPYLDLKKLAHKLASPILSFTVTQYLRPDCSIRALASLQNLISVIFS